MAHSNLLEVVRRPLSPDTRLEVPASREEYEQVGEILGREEASYPQLWYDSAKGVAIVVAPPTPLHSGMAGALLSSISDEVKMNSGISPAIRRNLRYDSDSTSHSNTTRGLTTRAWDGALLYREGDRLILMIAVEVGVSQSYDSLRAISWSVCALRCRLGLSMSISESSRRTMPSVRYYTSDEEAYAIIEEAENDFRSQLVQHPYGPLQRDGITWFGTVRRVILEAYRRQDEDCGPDTILEPSQSFTIVENGEYVGDNISPNLRELVLEDCIPSRLLQRHEVRATPVNFFRQEWFEHEFRASMVLTAIGRLRSYLEPTPI
ncbi:hypothetical protein V1525DRAFT_346155 [Lipomyces kononenkoae]|uniref:Uncharacterized protein n=1 Tax=Lipomyces kononenkoae TaxID=34357 RepID=A0ACC3SXP8_LIPKO